MKSKIVNGICHFFEYSLAFVYIVAGYSEFAYREVAPGALGVLISSDVAAYIYTAVFIGMGVVLLLSKWLRKWKWHKYALMMMYLVTIYTISLSVAIFGFAGAAVIDDGIIGIVAAGLWLRWKFKTEYLRKDEFYSKKLPFRIS